MGEREPHVFMAGHHGDRRRLWKRLDGSALVRLKPSLYVRSRLPDPGPRDHYDWLPYLGTYLCTSALSEIFHSHCTCTRYVFDMTACVIEIAEVLLEAEATQVTWWARRRRTTLQYFSD